MDRKIVWQEHIGPRVKLRDLHVFQTVAACRSMAKAASQLGVSQPTVSEVIADLEHAYRARLFDRTARGVELTMFGDALLRRTLAAFYELKQGARDIDFMTQPAAGELRIGSAESITASLLPAFIRRFTDKYPRVVVHVDDVSSRSDELTALRDRRYDLVLLRMQTPIQNDPLIKSSADDLTLEILFQDRLVIAAGSHSKWAKRRKIDLAELANEPWILMGPGTWNFAQINDAFQTQGLPSPRVSLVTNSLHLRTSLLGSGPFITALPHSAMRVEPAKRALKALPIALANRDWPVVVVTLKNWTLTPIVARFIECARELMRSSRRT